MGGRYGSSIAGKRVNRNRKKNNHQGRSFTEQLGRMIPTLPTNILHTTKTATMAHPSLETHERPPPHPLSAHGH